MGAPRISAIVFALALLLDSGPASAQSIVNATPRIGPECPLIFAVERYDGRQYDVTRMNTASPDIAILPNGGTHLIASAAEFEIYEARVETPDCEPILVVTPERATRDVVAIDPEDEWPGVDAVSSSKNGFLGAGFGGPDSFGIVADFAVMNELRGTSCSYEPVLYRLNRDQGRVIPAVLAPRDDVRSDRNDGGCTSSTLPGAPLATLWIGVAAMLLRRRPRFRRARSQAIRRCLAALVM